MYQYFKTAAEVAKSDTREFKSIRDLTIELAKSSGYHRGPKMKVDGVTPTKYTISTYEKWNEPLVAKWLLHYKDTFIHTLSKHPKLKPYYYDIIERTFHYVFQGLQLDAIKSDASINACVRQMLSIRIAEAFHCYGTEGRFERMETKEQKNSMMKKNAAMYASVSLEGVVEEKNMQFAIENEDEFNPFVMTLQSKFTTKKLSDEAKAKLSKKQLNAYKFARYRDNIGRRLLEAMLTTRQQREVKKEDIESGKDVETPEDIGMIIPEKIRDYIAFKPEEIDTEKHQKATALALSSAYNIIRKALYCEMKAENLDTSKYDWETNPRFGFENKRIDTQLERLNRRAEKSRQSNKQSQELEMSM